MTPASTTQCGQQLKPLKAEECPTFNNRSQGNEIIFFSVTENEIIQLHNLKQGTETRTCLDTTEVHDMWLSLQY